MLTVDNRQLQYRLDKLEADYRQEAEKVEGGKNKIIKITFRWYRAYRSYLHLGPKFICSIRENSGRKESDAKRP